MNDTSPESLEFREAMSRLAAPVHVVTTDGPAGRHGATATSVVSLTDAPPTLIVCLNRSSRAYRLASENRAVAVNLLGARHEALARAFSVSSGGAPDRRFDHGAWDRLATGAPTLTDALAVFDGRVTEESVVGTHAVLFVEIVALRVGAADDQPLLHHRRAYQPLDPG